VPRDRRHARRVRDAMTEPSERDVRPAEPSLGELSFPIEVQIPSDVRYIERVVGIVVQRCAESALPPRVCRLNVPVALTEALSNAILYGNNEDRNKMVRVRALIDERALILEIEDEGEGFDLEESTIDPTSDQNLLREDGRGLYLMRRLMDRVERFSQRGNVIRLTLHRA
jgi:serine/threonine-protein kinase RsbW